MVTERQGWNNQGTDKTKGYTNFFIKVGITHDLSLTYGATSDQPIFTKVLTNSQMTCDLDNYYLMEHLKVLLGDEVFFEKTWESSVPRIFG